MTTLRKEFERAERHLQRALVAEARVARLEAEVAALRELLGSAVGPTRVDFLPGLDEALHQARTGSGKADRSNRACPLCIMVQHAAPGPGRDHLAASAAGTMSGRALQLALRSIGLTVDRTTISAHRNEAHTP